MRYLYTVKDYSPSTVRLRLKTLLKFIYSEKTTQLCEISTLDLSNIVTIKSTVEILQNFTTFSEYITLTRQKMLHQLAHLALEDYCIKNASLMARCSCYLETWHQK